MPRVLVTPPMLQVGEWPYRAVLQQAGLEIVYPRENAAVQRAEGLLAALEGCQAVLASVEEYTPDVLAAAKLRVVARVGVGYDAVHVPAATASGTLVTITPGTNEHSVAEQTIAMLTGIYRGYPTRDLIVRKGFWERKSLPRLWGKTLGLVGLGRIGKAVVPRAQGLGLKVIAYDPFPDTNFAAASNVTLVSLDELFAQADAVSLHLPATAETTDLINARTLKLMKPGSVLLNTSRGALVDEDALLAALRSGHLLGAGLDVFKTEPLPADSPFRGLENVLLSPHTGGLDIQSIIDMSTLAAHCVAELFLGRWPDGCVVNAELRAGWKW